MILKSADEIIKIDEKYVIHGWGYNPRILVEGEGCVVKDIEGKEYIDCMAGAAGPALIGYRHPRVAKAIKEHVDSTLGIEGLTFVNVPRVELAEKLASIAPPGLSKIYFGIGGTDATETAVKGAILATGKKEVIGLTYGYYGFTLACVCLGGDHGPSISRKGLPIMPGFRQIPPPYCYRCFYGKEYPGCDFECARMLEHVIRFGSHDDVAAFILEPVLGNGGHILPPSEEYAKIIREICDKYGVLIIADEIQTGLGRTGRMWGSDYIGLKPDIIAVSKQLGGGMPLSATIFREELMPSKYMRELHWQAFSQSGTPITCAAGSAVLDVIVSEKVPEKAERMGRFLTEKLEKMQEIHPYIGEVRGPGLFIGVELVRNRETREQAPLETTKICRLSFENGVIFGQSLRDGLGNVIKIKPPVIITQQQANKVLSVLDDALTKIKRTN